MQDMLITIFCEIDIFLNEHTNKIRNRSHKLTLSEILTIMIFFNSGKRHNFKDYYEKGILNHYCGEFKNLVCYNRFLEFNKSHDILFIDAFVIKSFNKS